MEGAEIPPSSTKFVVSGTSNVNMVRPLAHRLRRRARCRGRRGGRSPRRGDAYLARPRRARGRRRGGAGPDVAAVEVDAHLDAAALTSPVLAVDVVASRSAYLDAAALLRGQRRGVEGRSPRRGGSDLARPRGAHSQRRGGAGPMSRPSRWTLTSTRRRWPRQCSRVTSWRRGALTSTRRRWPRSNLRCSPSTS